MQSILAIADPIDQEQLALAKAIDFAEKTGASIHLVCFCYDYLDVLAEDQAEFGKLKDILMSRRLDFFNKKIAEIDAKNLTIKIEVIWEKDITPWVIEHTKNVNYDLLIKTGHRSEDLFYTPTDWQLFRDSAAPVYIISNQATKKKKVVLVALDMATKLEEKKVLNKALIEAGFKLSVQVGGELHCCHAIKIPALVKDLDLIDVPAHLHRKEVEIMSRLNEFQEEYDLPETSLHVLHSNPEKSIPALARKLKADCVIIGCVGRKGIAGKLIGNTAEKVIHNLKSDLMVINQR
jgi:universal stress protein E